MQWIKHLLYLCLFVCSFSTIYAASNDTVPFSTKSAYLLLDQTLKTHDLSHHSLEELRFTIDQLTNYQVEARTCIDHTTQQLNALDQQLTALIGATTAPPATTTQAIPSLKQMILHTPPTKAPAPAATAPTAAVSSTFAANRMTLEAQKTTLLQQQSECQLFLLQSNQAIELLNHAIQHQAAQKLFTPRLPFWDNFYHTVFGYQEWTQALKNDSAFHFNTAPILALLSNQYVWLAWICLSSVFTMLFGIFFKKHAYPHDKSIPTSHLIAFYRALYQQRIYWRFLIPCSLSLCLIATAHMLRTQAMTFPLFFGLTFFIWLLWNIRAAFTHGVLPAPKKLHESHYRARLKHIIYSIILIYAISYLGSFFFAKAPTPAYLIEFLREIRLFALLIALYITLKFLSHLLLSVRHPRVEKIAHFFNLGFVSLLGGLDIWGYHYLVWHFLFNTFVTVASLTLAIMLTSIGFRFLSDIRSREKPWQQTLLQQLDIKPNRSVLEIPLLKLTWLCSVWGSFAVWILRTWELSAYQQQRLLNVIWNGFSVGNLTLIPVRIIGALFLYALLMALVRWIRQRIKTRYRASEPGTREAMSVITGYIGFGLATYVVLTMAGVRLTELAIIAGALSVGIGFGLQNIVSNFISGLILLIERPIKPGDRILVGDTEGFVRKIRIRSTHLQTPTLADVIVPNSDIISKQVTNLTFRDENWRLVLKVGVAYGSDTLRVKELLLSIANRHPLVYHDEINNPSVVFREFGDNALNFELWCSITDVNGKTQVLSELNFEIERVFRENQINIPFPQREVWLKS
ncbi:MAG: hypothetical protein A3J38_02805 [Gammaproteobacteria bacterium RIFCSPHIGHO2_12_FULL_45_9]|nr:MAG: hypothetical protein A3J38_02805 [Gammaproteobacteria bacterium RIFCSPHIGHO2_12_FULL_45_9]